MTPSAFLVALLAATATSLGFVSIVWVRVPATPHRMRRGSFLFLTIWMLVGIAAVAAMCHQPRYILPFCLIQGGLLIAMLWGEDHPLEDPEARIWRLAKRSD